MAGLTGIGLHADGVCLVQVARVPGQPPRVPLWLFQPWDGADRGKQLAHLAHEHGLKRAACTTVLDASEYSLLLTEAPAVPPEELKAAIRWRVKDLLDFHINDAVLDVFDVPGQEAGKPRAVYAVAARRQTIQQRVDLMHAASVDLRVIDIPEMAQRNLAALLPEDAQGVVALSFGADGGLITITKQGELYLSRGLEISQERLSQGGDLAPYFDRVVLEVQRSLDYFDSHFRQAPIGQLVLLPMEREVPGLIEHCRENLSVQVQPMDLAARLQLPEAPPALQARCLMTLGAALRQEEVAL